MSRGSLGMALFIVSQGETKVETRKSSLAMASLTFTRAGSPRRSRLGLRWWSGRNGRCRNATPGIGVQVQSQGRGELGHFGEDVRADVIGESGGGELRRAALVNEERDQANDGRGLDDGRGVGGKIKFEDGRATRGKAGGGKSKIPGRVNHRHAVQTRHTLQNVRMRSQDQIGPGTLGLEGQRFLALGRLT